LRKAAYYRKYFEDTHIELLEAKRMMDEAHLHSAILVSSPYHMRRIRLIAGKVFGDGKQTFSCVPTSYERSFDGGGWLEKQRRDKFMSEYIKICWYLIYMIFGEG
jgi:uncharacterized SAM-binding protein YcdF (DUF218 family)